MPLVTEIRRDGNRLSLNWGWWHLNCMVSAAKAEGHDLFAEGKVTLTETHSFTDPEDGEVLVLMPGDELGAWREMK